MKWSPAARAFVILVAAIVATGVLVVVLLVYTKDDTARTVSQSEQNFRALKDQEALLRIVLAVTGCTVDDTGEQCAARIKANGGRNMAELDCRIRRAIDGLAAPADGESCLPTTTTTRRGGR